MNGKMLDNCCLEAIVHVENTNFTQTFSSEAGGEKIAKSPKNQHELYRKYESDIC